jgi:hypothetical protein
MDAEMTDIKVKERNDMTYARIAMAIAIVVLVSRAN